MGGHCIIITNSSAVENGSYLKTTSAELFYRVHDFALGRDRTMHSKKKGRRSDLFLE